MVKKGSESVLEEKKETKTTKARASKKAKKKASSDEQEVALEEEPVVQKSATMSLEERRRAEAKAFKVTVSFSLYKKLLSQAEEEGISLDEYVGEILTEGCVVRAWEINALNVNNTAYNNNNKSNFRPQGQRPGGFRNNKGKKSGSHITYEDIMNDKASFLEYVRRKDKRR